MKIAFNPSTVAALTTPPNNKDITFDLRGQNIFARGVKFCGTDTNTWRDIKINNVSIGSNILDLRNGSNTTLTNTNGIVTINSTWRPVVDNLTSDSTTSSLSANQGRILKALIDSKLDSNHNHDDRYLKLTGGTMTGNIILSPHITITKPLVSTSNYDSVVRWSVDGETKQYGREIGLHNTGGSDSTGSIAIVPYKTDAAPWLGAVGLFIAKNTLKLDGKPIAFKSDIPSSVKNPHALTISLNGTSQGPYDGSAAKNINITPGSIGAATSGHNHDGRYLRLSGQDTMQGNLNLFSYGSSYIGRGSGDKSGADFTEANIVIRSWWGISFKSYDDIVRTYIDTRTGNIGTKGILNAVGTVIQGRVYNSGDDEGIIIKPASNGWAGLILGAHNGERSVFYYKPGNAFWRYGNGSGTMDIYHPKKSGTIALTSDIPDKNSWNYDDRYLKLTGGTMFLGEGLKFHADNNYFGTDSDARIISLLDGNDKICGGGLIIDERATLDGKEYVTELLRIRDSEFKWRGSNILHSGNSYINGSTITINGSSLNIIDQKVTQTFVSSGYTDFRAVLITAGTSGSAGYTPGTVTGQTFITNALQLSPQAGNLYLKGSAAIGTTNFNRKLNVNGDIGLLNAGSIRDLSIGGGIYWNPYVESTTDSSDAASITVVKSGVEGGTTLVLSQMNDANDTIQFKTNAARLYHNSYPILTTQNTYVSNNKGYINGTEITQVNNASNATNSINSNRLNSNTEFALGNNFLQYFNTAGLESSGVKNAAPDKDWWHIIRMNHPNNKGYFSELAIALNSFNGVYWRTINEGREVKPWTKLANIEDLTWSNITGKPSSYIPSAHTHSWTSITDKLVAGNEFNIVNSGFNSELWFNYLPINNRNSTATVRSYYFGNGAGGQALVQASGFIKSGSSSSYVLLGDGGHKAVSDFASSSHSHNYAANEYYGGFTKSGRLPISGFYQSNESGSGGNAPWPSWMHLINCQHSNTVNNYALQIAASFYDNNIFKIRVTNNNVNNAWRDIIHSGNIGNQTVANAYHLRINSANTWSTWYWLGQSGQPSWLWGSNDGTNMYVYNPSNFRVAYATSAGNADTVDGYHANSFLIDRGGDYTGLLYNLPCKSIFSGYNLSDAPTTGWVSGIVLGSNWNNSHYQHYLVEAGSRWYATRSSSSGKMTNWNTFAYLTDIPNPTNYYWANVKISASSSTTTSPTVHTLTATRVCAGHNPGIDNSISCSNWFRSSGNTGWYNTTYQGGWYMSDTSWIRAYNSVGIYTGGQIYSSRSIRMGNILLEHTDEINNSDDGGIHLNYRNSGNVSLCQGGGSVGVGTISPSYKLDVNGQMRAGGFHHGSVNSDNYILLAGGGYKSFGGDDSTPIFLGYLNLDHGNDGTVSSSFYCLGYSVPFTYTRGGNYCRISIPDTTRLSFYINAAIASVNYSGGGMDTWVGQHRGTGAWWLHCYASGWNEVRVKGFRQTNSNNDSWWGGNPLWSGNDGANRITVCIFGYVRYK